MKTLFVLRHAKSSWDCPGLSDYERPLNKRGKKTAPFIGKLMAEKRYIPECILSSPAKRAEQTTTLVMESSGIEADVFFDKRIYEASANTLLHIVSETKEKFESAMIVGHNPGFESLVEVLIGKHNRLTTANLAVIDLNIKTWHEISSNCGNLQDLIRPKEHMRESEGFH